MAENVRPTARVRRGGGGGVSVGRLKTASCKQTLFEISSRLPANQRRDRNGDRHMVLFGDIMDKQINIQTNIFKPTYLCRALYRHI